MRCDNCGWPNNAAGRSNCEKCNASLRNGSPKPQSPQSPRAGQPENTPSPFQKTVQGRKAEMPSWDAPAYTPPPVAPKSISPAAPQGKLICGSCDYPNHGEAVQCVSCGNPLSVASNPAPTPVPPRPVQSPPANPFMGTIDPYRTGTSTIFSLKPIARAREIAVTQQPIVFNAGDKVALHRDNVDPGNVTITSKGQATVVLIDGKWHLVDNSSQQTSFVLAKEPIALQKGDIILLGDRKFEFDC